MAKFIGKSRAHISNCLRLLTLPKKIIQNLVEDKITQGHAKILVGLENAELLVDKIIKKKLSVRQAEALARLTKNKPLKIKSLKDANIIDMENQISSKIGMKVNIKNKRNNSGTLTFEYKDIDQLDRIVQVIKDNY